IAERLELVREDGDPCRDGEPSHRGVVVEVGVGREAALAQHGPRLLHVDALVGDVEGLREEVIAVRERSGCNRRPEQEAVPLRPGRLLRGPFGGHRWGARIAGWQRMGTTHIGSIHEFLTPLYPTPASTDLRRGRPRPAEHRIAWRHTTEAPLGRR